jgi:ferredoxin
MRAIVDQNTCIGCGLCPQICPDVFRMEGEKALVYTDPVPPEVEDLAQEAADQCPVNAITTQTGAAV